MKILVTGGCGYKGSVLIPKLLNLGYSVISIDTKWFGDFLPKHKKLKNLKLDLKDIEKVSLKGVNSIIHLASIANDPMSELDKNLSWETSALNTYKLVEHAKKYNVRKFIYASSGSVYGIKKEKKVTENLSLKPISLYNKVKMCTERILLSYDQFFDLYIIRPATVCGYSPRMRFDLTVNALTISALKNSEINVFGGNQIRPNIHIQDITDFYIYLLSPGLKKTGIYNAGFENISVLKIAEMVKKKISSKILVKKNNNDPRSYRLDSSLLLKNFQFKPQYNVSSAIEEIKFLYEKKMIKNNPRHHSVKWLKSIIKI
jgi:nucleoside-diphosphate-sugar epimerase